MKTKLFSFLFFLILFSSCNNQTGNGICLIKNKKPFENNTANKKIIECYQDSTINDLIRINNAESIINSFGDISLKINKNENDDWDVYFKNKKGDEYLRLIFYPDLSYIHNNEFSFFEVGYVKDINNKAHLFQSGFMHFNTSSGCSLGISLDSLYKIKGKDFKITRTAENSAHIIKYCKDLYVEEYSLKNDTIISFGFGYYPE